MLQDKDERGVRKRERSVSDRPDARSSKRERSDAEREGRGKAAANGSRTEERRIAGSSHPHPFRSVEHGVPSDDRWQPDVAPLLLPVAHPVPVVEKRAGTSAGTSARLELLLSQQWISSFVTSATLLCCWN